ncbi:hypothetical protein [Rufibacter immobilis]|uniref:hypothetical protein n=1 Tax=Rufibacter immobilis TaxID=1348778 RepID=UPI0035E7BD82
MRRTSERLTKTEKDELNALLSERFIGKKNNLLYLASGTKIRERYSELSDFDNVVLVDKAMKTRCSINGNIIRLSLTAIEANALFLELGIRFQYLILINCGINEGGGSYTLGSNWSYGFIQTIMDDSFIHINCPQEHGRRKFKKYFNLPQTAVLLDKEDEQYIDPTIFSDYHRYGKEFCVWKVTKQDGVPASFKLGSRTVTVQRRSIFDSYEEVDALFVRSSPNEFPNLKSVAPKVQYLKDFTFEQMLKFCTDNNIAKISLCPWLRGSYNGFLDYLLENEISYPFPKEVSFAHLNSGDFFQVYDRAKAVVN